MTLCNYDDDDLIMTLKKTLINTNSNVGGGSGGANLN